LPLLQDELLQRGIRISPGHWTHISAPTVEVFDTNQPATPWPCRKRVIPRKRCLGFREFPISEIVCGADEFFKGSISRQRQASSLKLWGLPKPQHHGECSDTSTFRGSQTNFAKQNKNKIDTLLAIQVKNSVPHLKPTEINERERKNRVDGLVAFNETT